MPSSRNGIPPQAPELSPTYLSSVAQSNPSTTSVRRNLFSAHLSRRPASSSQSSSQQSQQQQQSTVTSPFSSHPPRLQPTQLSMSDIYDPQISPNHPLSPSSSAKLFPGASIVAVHPVTGRPILPNLPSLPGRLRLSEDDEDEEEEEEEEGGNIGQIGEHEEDGEDDTYAAIAAKTTYTGGIPAAASASYMAEADDERRERERIERLLSKIVGRQRQRAKGKDVVLDHKVIKSGGRDATRSRGRRRNSLTGTTDEIGDGDSENGEEAETEELMGLIMASLRRQVAVADEEGWMYGDAGNLVGNAGGEMGIGVYD